MTSATPRRPLVYLAHPYGGDPANLARAKRWREWAFREYFPDLVFLAPWIEACESVPETPENRAAGLAFDLQVVQICDEMWLVGGAVSPGMKHEALAARRVVDLTHLGLEPPAITSPPPGPLAAPAHLNQGVPLAGPPSAPGGPGGVTPQAPREAAG